jgi:hypothetical protein
VIVKPLHTELCKPLVNVLNSLPLLADAWILSDGNWNDTKIWVDNETWRDS